jgi:hypothetical protein
LKDIVRELAFEVLTALMLRIFFSYFYRQGEWNGNAVVSFREIRANIRLSCLNIFVFSSVFLAEHSTYSHVVYWIIIPSSLMDN